MDRPYDPVEVILVRRGLGPQLYPVECRIGRVEATQSVAMGTDPDAAGTIGVNGPDYALRLRCRTVTVSGDLTGRRIEPIESIGTYPDSALRVLGERGDQFACE